MSYIYKIINDINDKVYIGKTNLSIEKRFKQHCSDCIKNSKQKRPLYAAMQKYGIEHFSIHLIEECSTNKASEREQYWIGYYQGYEKGYNATKGGDGKQYFDHEQIARVLKKVPYPKQVADLIGCSVDTVRIVAKEYHIEVKNSGQEQNINTKRIIHQYDKNTQQYIQSFDSIQLAAEWLKEQEIIQVINSGVRSHISAVANGKRKSAYGFVWRY